MFKKKKHKSAEGADNEAPKAIVGSGGASRFRLRKLRLRKINKKLALIVAGILVVGAAAVAGVAYIQNNDGYRASDDTDSSEPLELTPAEEAALEVRSSYNPESGEGYEDAIAALDRTLDEVKGDKAQETQIYMNKISVYMNAGQYQHALETGKLLEGQDPSFISSAVIADAAKALGDNTEAAKYYKITIDRLKAFEYYNQTDVDYYQNLLNEVEAG